MCTTTTLTLGQHSLSASYAGDANNASSVSAAFTEVIKQAPQLLLEVSPNPAIVTGNVMLKLTASATTGMPTGTMTFYDGTTALSTAPLNTAGVATLTTNQLVPGLHTLTAQYDGDSSNATGTSNAVSEIINQAQTVTTLASSSATISVGAAVTLSAQVSSSFGPTPTGSISFSEGSTVLGTAALDASGRASFSLAALAPGAHSFTTIYSGDTDSATSTSSALAVAVAQISTVTTLTASANPLSAGAVLHLNASVALSPGSIAAGALTGAVTFSDRGTLLGTDVLDGSGQATLAVPGFSVATHPITATFGGSTNYGVSNSAALNEVVSSTPTTVSLTGSSTASLAGKSVTFTVAMASATGIPTGTAVLHDGATILGQAALSSSGSAIFTLSSLAVGTHTLSATYAGDANYSPATSPSLGLSVALAQPTFTLNGPTSAVNAGTTAAFNASIASNGVTPSGTLTFRDGSATLATQAVGAGAASFSTDSLAVGSHAITVVYSGDDDNAPITSGVLTVLVQQGATATTLTGASRVTLGTNLTLAVSVSSSSPHLTGTVTFVDGATVLGTAVLGVTVRQGSALIC